MDGSIEQELRRLADEQGRDLSEVVETALRHYIVSETFADDGSAGVHHALPPVAADDSVLAADSVFGDSVFAADDLRDGDSVFGDSVFGDGGIPGEGPSADGESVIDGPLEIAGLGDRPPSADSDTVIVGSIDWSDED